MSSAKFSVLAIATALLVLNLSSTITDSFNPEISTTQQAGCLSATRKLKGSGFRQTDGGSLNLNDYDPIDPVPSYKTSIKPGPIEHGSPIIPYIPKPLPPDHPKVGGGS